MSTEPSPKPTTNDQAALTAILAEHGALYQLVEFRLGALDRRIPTASGVLTTFLGLVPLMPASSQLLALIAVPISLIWLVRATINHARSLEDALVGIETLEHRINALIGADAMSFQSTHPSRDIGPGRRTAAESVGAIIVASTALLAMVVWLAMALGSDAALVAVLGIAALVAAVITRSVLVWRRYQARSVSPTH